MPISRNDSIFPGDMIYTPRANNEIDENQKGTLEVSLFTQVSRLILKLSNGDNMEKLKEYIYIYSCGTFKEEEEGGEGRNHFPFSYFDSTVARS